MLTALRARLVTLSVAIVAVMLAVVAESRPLGVSVLALSLVALALGPSLDVERGRQAGLSFAALVVGVLAPRVLAVEAPTAAFLSDRALLFTCAGLLVAIVRGLFRAPFGGAATTLAFALVALAGCGRASSQLYPVAVAAFVMTALVAMAAHDPGRAWPADAGLRQAAKVALGLSIFAAVGAGIAAGAPRVHVAIVERIAERMRDRSGFSGTMSLGSLEGMLQSDVVVARVRHGAPAYLRGAVFSRYVNGLWQEPAGAAPLLVETEVVPHAEPDVVEIELARRPERYFLPLEATSVRVSTGQLFLTTLGMRQPSSPQYAKRLWYRPGAPPEPEGPQREDVTVPARVLPELQAIATAWGLRGSDRERLDAIEARLHKYYTYSLDFERTERRDPVLDFLDTHPQGHCEYFASALALLARASGIPARVVTGFRVIESSSLGDYRIVRERDAHAWVEAFVEGRWVELDPTPAASLSASDARATPFGAALSDLIATSWERVDDFLGERSPFELSLALVALLGLLLLVRWLRSRGAVSAAPEALLERPLPCYVALEAALGRRGLSRARHETLGAFAARIAQAGDPRADLDAASAIVGRYAELRYGGGGDPVSVAREMDAIAARLA